MSRHAPDDFSFLPTVDSTDDEDVQKETLWKSKQPPPQPELNEQEHEVMGEHFPAEEQPAYEEPVYEEQAHEEPAYEEPAYEEPVHEEIVAAPPAPPVFVKEPPPVKKGRLLEPDEAHASAETAPKKEELPAAKVKPSPAPLAKLEGIASLPAQHAPAAVEKSVAAVGKASAEPAAKVLPRSDDAAADKPKADKDPKPFIAPKPPLEEPLDPEEAKKLRWKKLADKVGLRTLGMSFGVHLFLLLIACFIGVSQVMDKQVDFLPGGSSPQSQAASEALTQKVQTKKNPWLKARPQQRKITVQTLSADITLPEMPPMDMMDFSKINNQMSISKAGAMSTGQPGGMGLGGAGGGLGAGIGRGGKFSFVGQTAVGRRVVFVVDVSGSMSNRLKGENQGMSRFDLLKKELIKAVKQIPMGTAYQVLFFSDFAWPHNEVDSRNSSAMEKYRWEIKSEDYKKVKIPTFKYIVANPFSLQESEKIIQNADNPGGTNWGSGLLMALNANPKPDIIFFMTDGERQDEMGWIDVVTAENKRKLPMTVIHTSVMAQIDAAREMDSLAKRNNGKFTVITDDGKVVKGEDFFK